MSKAIPPPGDLSLCPYCSAATKIADSKVIYGSSYGPVLMCSNYPKCNSFVGIHKGTDIPKGTLAGPGLRNWRKRAHGLFDKLWRERGMHRRQAYQYLAKILGVPPAQAHIGWCDEKQCAHIVEALTAEASV